VGIVYEICEIGDKFLFLKCGAAYSWCVCILAGINHDTTHQCFRIDMTSNRASSLTSHSVDENNKMLMLRHILSCNFDGSCHDLYRSGASLRPSDIDYCIPKKLLLGTISLL
jgi:hypothetical protein